MKCEWSSNSNDQKVVRLVMYMNKFDVAVSVAEGCWYERSISG